MRFNNLNTVLGIELKTINDNEFSCRYSILIKNRNLLNIKESTTIEGTLSFILSTLPKTFPVALTLTGKGVVQKNIMSDEEIPSEKLFQQAFPAIDENDFYVQQFIEQQQGLLSLARKQSVDELIDKMTRSGLTIYVISFGGIVSASIWSQLNCYGTEIKFDSHSFERSTTHQFLSYQNNNTAQSEFQIKIGQQPINQEHIIAYATAFQLLLHQQVHLICANVEHIQAQFLQLVENHVIKKQLFLFLALLFSSLLISYVVFSYYNDKNMLLSRELSTYTATTDQIDLLQKNIVENETTLKQLNWNGGFNYGFLVNEIGQSMPKHLQLQEVTINEFKLTSNTEMNNPCLRVIGVTDNLSALNNWIFVLKQKPWVKEVRLLKYEEYGETEQYKFNLSLNY